MAKYNYKASRLRKYTCACTEHATDSESESLIAGPYIIRAAGDALMARCEACGQMFKLQDDAATRTNRVRGGCAHCSEPGAHAGPCVSESGQEGQEGSAAALVALSCSHDIPASASGWESPVMRAKRADWHKETTDAVRREVSIYTQEGGSRIR